MKKRHGHFRQILKIMWCVLLCFGLVLSSKPAGCEKIANLPEFIKRMEENVKILRDALVQQYSKLCGSDIQTCKIKSYDLCEGSGKRECLNNFPTPSQCYGDGLWLSNESGVRISNVFSKKNLTNNARKFICASALIEPVFEKLRKNNQIQYSYAYIGSSSGVIRVSPGFKQEQNSTTNRCVNYDPRKRPWYISALTGAKTTIILLDISKTMTSLHPGVRLGNAKTTLDIIFKTMNSFDYIGVVVFCKKGRSLVFNSIVQASEENKDKILQQILKLKTGSGSTNYTSAIQVGMSMLKDVKIECQQTVFLLLTDGYTDADKMPSFESLSTLIQTKFTKLGNNVDNFKLISFVYGVEENINYNLVKELTCKYKGIIFRIWDGAEEFTMVEKLANYYIFLSKGMNLTQIKPLWSNPYLDAFGFGMIVSVTMPIYVPGSNQIIGVAAIDILLSKFEQCGYNLKDVENHLRRKPKCFKSSLTPEQLLQLRCKQGNTVCTNATCDDVIISPEEICSASISHDVFYETPIDYTNDDDKCCVITIKKVVIISTTSVMGVIFLAVGIFLYKKGYLQRICNWRKSRIAVENQDYTQEQLIRDKNILEDPQKKYKKAEENGIRIYRQERFQFES